MLADCCSASDLPDKGRRPTSCDRTSAVNRTGVVVAVAAPGSERVYSIQSKLQTKAVLLDGKRNGDDGQFSQREVPVD